MPKYLNRELTEEEKHQKRLDRGTYTLDENFFRGFKTSVRNGQVMLALEHLAEYLTDVQNELDALAVEPEVVVETPASKPAPKKAAEVAES